MPLGRGSRFKNEIAPADLYKWLAGIGTLPASYQTIFPLYHKHFNIICLIQMGQDHVDAHSQNNYINNAGSKNKFDGTELIPL